MLLSKKTVSQRKRLVVLHGPLVTLPRLLSGDSELQFWALPWQLPCPGCLKLIEPGLQSHKWASSSSRHIAPPQHGHGVILCYSPDLWPTPLGHCSYCLHWQTWPINGSINQTRLTTNAESVYVLLLNLQLLLKASTTLPEPAYPISPCLLKGPIMNVSQFPNCASNPYINMNCVIWT